MHWDHKFLNTLVEIEGLKPSTSSMPWKHSNQLSYIPTRLSMNRLRSGITIAKIRPVDQGRIYILAATRPPGAQAVIWFLF